MENERRFTGRMNYPMNLMTLFFEKLVGNNMLDPEFASLKSKIEKQ